MGFILPDFRSSTEFLQDGLFFTRRLLLIRQFQQNIGVARLAGFAKAGQVLAAQFWKASQYFGSLRFKFFIDWKLIRSGAVVTQPSAITIHNHLRTGTGLKKP
jgi:hypothetical protein